MSITVKDAKEFFNEYLNDFTSTPDGSAGQNKNTQQPKPVQVSQIPSDVTTETLIALVTYKPELYKGTVLQKNSQNIQILSSSISARLLATNAVTAANLYNYKPYNFSGNAIQRRNNAVLTPLDARGFLLRGINPETQKALKLLEDARNLIKHRDTLDRAVRKAEAQINRYATLLNRYVTLPTAAGIAAVNFLMNRINQLSLVYENLKKLAQLVASALRAIRDKYRQIKEKIKKYREAKKKTEEIKKKIKKIKEVVRVILFPKFPKFPRLSISFADLYQRYKQYYHILKDKNGPLYKEAYKVLYQNAGFEEPPSPPFPIKINPFTGREELDALGRPIRQRPDAIQTGLRNARNALRLARVKLQATQTVQTAAVNQARLKLIKNVRTTAEAIERGRQEALKEYQNILERKNQIGARKRYLSVSEQLMFDTKIDVTFKNIFGDKPTGEYAVSDNKKVYLDNSSRREDGSRTIYGENYGRKYVLVSATERVETAKDKVNNVIVNTTQKFTNIITTGSNIAGSALDAYSGIVSATKTLSTSLNDKQIKAELGAGIFEAQNETNRYAVELETVATEQLRSASAAEEDKKRKEADAAKQQLINFVSSTIPPVGDVKFTPATITALPRMYHTIVAGVKIRQEPGNSAPVIKQLSVEDNLTLITEVASGTSTGTTSQFVQKDDLVWGKFKLISTTQGTLDVVGWIPTKFLRPQTDLVSDQIGQVASSFPQNNFSLGSKGENVKSIQRRLNFVLNSKLVTDGDYGQATTREVRNFQLAFNLPNTGIVNKNTWDKLFAADIYEPPKVDYVVKNAQGTRFREKPSTSGRVISLLMDGTPIEILNDNYFAANGFTWVKVRTNDVDGWVAKNFISPQPPYRQTNSVSATASVPTTSSSGAPTPPVPAASTGQSSPVIPPPSALGQAFADAATARSATAGGSLGQVSLLETAGVSLTNTKLISGKVLIVGDSISAEFYNGAKTGTWATKFKDVNAGKLDVEILAIGGKRLVDWMRPELSAKLRAGSKYNKIVIYGGVNDMFSSITPQQAIANLQNMVNEAKATGAQVVVVTGYDTENDMNINKIPRTIYVKTAEGYIPLKAKYMEYQKLISTITGATIVPIVRLGELSDGVHPYGSKVTTLLNHISRYI